MNEGLTFIWADNVLGKFSFSRRLLAWDSFSCHIMDSVKDKVKENYTDMVGSSSWRLHKIYPSARCLLERTFQGAGD